MLQILGEAMMIATRNERQLSDPRRTPARPLTRESEEPKVRRRGWLQIGGLFL
jgi:hypothetical protein